MEPSATAVVASNASAQSSPSSSQIPDMVKIGAIPSSTVMDVETSMLEPVQHSQTSCRFVLENKGILHSHSKIILQAKAPTIQPSVLTLSIDVAGTEYTTGSHNNVTTTTTGFGKDLTVDVVISEAGVVTAAVVGNHAGTNYAVGDTITLDASVIGAGSDTLAISVATIQEHRAYWPIQVGCMGAVSRARLSSGGKTLMEQTDFNHLTSYESMFLSNEHNKEKEIFQNGRLMAHGFDLEQDNAGTTPGKAKGVKIDVGYDKGFSGDVLGVIPSQIESASESEFQISLSDLFPFLRQQQLPLYMMKEQVTITLEFAPQTERLWVTSGHVVPSVELDVSATRLVADYQHFPGEMMEAFARQNADLALTYMVYRLSKTSIDAGTSQKIRNIGGNGRIVTQIVSGLEDTSKTFLKEPLGKYSSVAPGNVSATQGGEISLNVKYNNHLLYPEDVSNFAQHQHNTAQSKGMVPFVTRYEYSGEGGSSSVSDMGLEGVDLQFLDGTFCWQSHRLNRNERINSRGIEYQAQYNLNSGARVQRVWLEIARVAKLTDGKFNVIDA